MNRCIAVEDSFTTTLEKVVNKKAVEALERANLEVETGRGRGRGSLKGAFEAATAKYLASSAFEIIKANYFWEGFENFRDLVVEAFSDLDFSSIKPNKGEVEADGGQEEAAKKEGEK